jgi:transcriptional regulator with XRE-family HTH domain
LNLAERIRTARKARQLSQEEIAHRAGLSLRAYRSLERGEAVDPHYSTLNKLAEGLGVPVRELLEDERPLVGAR